MKFKIDRDHFTNGLALVLNVIGAKATLPILSNVLLVAGEDVITLTTSNLDLAIRCRVKANVTEAGGITLPAKRLAAIVRELPHNDVSVEVARDGGVKIRSGDSFFRIMGLSADDFPPISESKPDENVELSQDDLRTMLKNVAYAMSTDETRFILCGALLDFGKGSFTTAATDGRRLSVYKKPLENPGFIGQIILPAKTTGEVMRMLCYGKDVSIAIDTRRAVFRIGVDGDERGLVDGIDVFSKVVDGKYPNYKSIIPNECKGSVSFERELFLQCIARAAIVCSEKSNAVRFRFTANQLEITANVADFGDAREVIAIEYPGPDIEVSFAPRFLTDALSVITHDNVLFQFTDATGPGVIKAGTEFQCIVMPVRNS